MTRHTQGPWRIGDAGNTIFGPKTDQPAPVTIANLPPPSVRVDAKERATNARLIASAPDMLEALELLANITTFGPEGLVPLPGNIIGYVKRTAQEAINKAKGL